MKAACYSVDITPPIGFPIGGNVRSDNKSRGIHDPLYANLLLLINNNEKTLFIGLDIIFIYKNLAEQIREDLIKRYDINKDNITIFATHTHSGPDIVEAFESDGPKEMGAYKKELVKKISKGFSACLKNIWEAEIGVGKGEEHSLSFNRRFMMKDGTVQMNWEEVDQTQIEKTTGPIDPDLYVIAVRDKNEKIRSVVVNFTLHSAILVGKDWLFSRDFIHRLTESLKDAISEDLVVLFANGAEGNINHIDIKNKNQSRGFEEANRVGEKLATNTLEILKYITYKSNSHIQVLTKKIKLPRRVVTEEQVKRSKELLEKVNWKIPSLLDGIPDEMYAIEIIKLHEDKRKFLETDLQVIKINDTLIATLPGEFFVEFGLQIKKHSPSKHTMIFGMANDCVGYIPTKKAFTEGGYEIQTASTSQLKPDAGELVVEKLFKMLREVNQVS